MASKNCLRWNLRRRCSGVSSPSVFSASSSRYSEASKYDSLSVSQNGFCSQSGAENRLSGRPSSSSWEAPRPQRRFVASCQLLIVAPNSLALKSVARSMARAGSDISRAQRVCSARVISTQSMGKTFCMGLASHNFSTTESKGSFRTAPSGNSAASSPVLIPGIVSHGTLAPGVPSSVPCSPSSTPPTRRTAPSRAEHRYRGCQSCLRSSSLPPQRDSPAASAASLYSTVLFYPLCRSLKNGRQGSSGDPVPQSPRPATERPRHLPGPTSHPDGPPRPLYPPPVPTGFEEGDHFPVHIGEPLDKDEVARVVEDAQPGARDGPGEGRRVGDGHVAILGAVDHERGRGYVPDISREVEVRPGPGLLVVGGAGRRVSETPAYDLLELIPVLGAIRRRSRRLEAPSDDPHW